MIVLSWNRRDDTLASLRAALAIQRDDVQVLCVDNGSVDGTPEAVRRELPEVALVENATNLGFAGGNNVGIQHALGQGARWIVLLNNDAVIAPDAIDGFEAAAVEHPRAGILGGKVFYKSPPDRIWFAGQRFRTLVGYSGRPRGYGRPDGPKYRQLVVTDRAVGALMAVSSEAMATVGFLDEDLFAYVEDVEWSLRMRKAGFEVLLAPAARAWHGVSASSGGEDKSTYPLYYGTRNTIVVCERHRPLGATGTLVRRVVVVATFTAHALTRADRRAAVAAVRVGCRDAIAGRLGAWPGAGG